MPSRKPASNISHRDNSTSAVRNRARVEALFASIGEGAVATDDKGRIIRINQVALKMLGLKKSEVLRKRFIDVIVAVNENGDLLSVTNMPIAKVYLSGQAVHERIIYKLRDGSILPAQVTASPIMFDGAPIGAIVVFRDLSLEIEADKMKSDFISVASHQLRTPLTAINIYTRMLEENLAGNMDEQQHMFIQTILNSVERMNELISTLLNITRIEAGGIKIRPVSVQPADLVLEMLTEIEPAVKAKKLKLASSIKGVGSVVTDSLLVKEIVANLLSNAIKYTSEGGSISVALSGTKNDIVFSVTDTGCGIPAADQKRIFTKFFRADNALSQDANGTGLGLYLTKIIAQHLDGDMWFTSTENRGSTFYFSLPRTGLSRKPTKLKLSAS